MTFKLSPVSVLVWEKRAHEFESAHPDFISIYFNTPNHYAQLVGCLIHFDVISIWA